MQLNHLLIESGQFPNIKEEIPSVDISGISFDSRKVKPGDIFFALDGKKVDGHQFIPQAVKAGAKAIIGRLPIDHAGAPYFQVENPRQSMAYIAAALNGFPAKKLTIIGVTGTDGKTTTVNLIYRILLANEINAGMISTVNAVIGNEMIDTGFHVTTPESPIIQALLAKMVDMGATHVVLETTSHGLDQFRVEACEFDIAVITNITHEHLDYHGTYEHYFSSKYKLIEYLLEKEAKMGQIMPVAVFNGDDISYPKILERIQMDAYEDIRWVVYGLGHGMDVYAEKVEMDVSGLRFNVTAGSNYGLVNSPLIGEYNVYNILAAIGASVVGLELPLDKTLEGVHAMHSVPGRMEKIDLGQDFTAIVDFAHTPNALKVALQTVRKLTSERVIAVFGSAGLRDQQKRRMMAAVSSELADITVLTAEDPRTEPLEDILKEMADEACKTGAREGENLFIIPDRGEAILEALKMARTGDVVIACGKGHEQSMCFGEIEYPWDDRTAMRAALAEITGQYGPEMPMLPTSGKKKTADY